MVNFDKKYLSFYLVIETPLLKIPLEEFIPQVLEAGVTTIQLRDKFASRNERYYTGIKIKKYLNKSSSPLFIVNDDIDLAVALMANGVHLGEKDVHPVDCVKMASQLIIGYSCNTLDDCEIASAFANYAGVGPVYPTDTKKDLRSVIGIKGLKQNIEMISCPAVAIGGIGVSNAAEVLKSGVCGVAVSSCICASNEPYLVAKKLADTIKNERV